MDDVNVRTQSLGEEIANSITHGAGLMAAIAAIPLLLLASRGPGDAWQIVGAVIFGVALVLLYTASTVYHALPPSRAKRVLRVLDHSAIYILIAGTYTPFALGVLRGPWGWALLGAAWTLALLGIVAKLTVGFRFPRLSTMLYLSMGWMALVAAGPLIERVSAAGLAWLIAGGLCYTGGVFFYSTDGRIRYGHALWHLFVIAGSTCHFFAVLWHSAPMTS
jgi:hemolysin III